MLFVDHRCRGLGAFDDRAHGIGGEAGIEHDHDTTDPKGAKDRRHILDTIGEHDQDTVARRHTRIQEPAGVAGGEPVDFPIAEGGVVETDRHLAA